MPTDPARDPASNLMLHAALALQLLEGLLQQAVHCAVGLCLAGRDSIVSHEDIAYCIRAGNVCFVLSSQVSYVQSQLESGHKSYT